MAVDVDTNYQVGIPEVRIMPDREQAAARGVTTSAIARTINSTIGGVRAGKYTKGGRRYDIRVSLKDINRSDLNDISKLLVRNVRGELIPLSEVTKIVEKPTLLNIQREDRQRAITVSGNIAPGKSQADALKVALNVAHEVLPEGYYVAETGNTEQFRETFGELGFALFMGIAIAYMILAAQFNSFIHPLVILLALPFSLSGALFGLWIGGHSLNMMMGIVKKNSILLVDFTNAERLNGSAPNEALLKACPLRLRPILMTSFAIVAGALPAVMAFGPGAEMRAPMGAVVIGGTVLSTLLTLYVVPCAYSLISRFESKDRDHHMREVSQAIASSSK
jgi:multidrug efflux pump subunit AcrB